MCWRLLNNSLNPPRSSYQTDILSFCDVYHDHKRCLLISTLCLTAGGLKAFKNVAKRVKERKIIIIYTVLCVADIIARNLRLYFPSFNKKMV